MLPRVPSLLLTAALVAAPALALAPAALPFLGEGETPPESRVTLSPPVALDSPGGKAMEPHVALREAPGGPIVVVANMNEIPGDVPANTRPVAIEIHRSLDGGATWTTAPLPMSVVAPFDPLGRMANTGDAVLAYAPDGTLWLAGVATEGFSGGALGGESVLYDFAVFLTKSTDDGATWSPAVFWQKGAGVVGAGVLEDKEWVTVGPDGAIHFTWTEFRSLVTAIRYVRSTDGGATFSAPRDLVSADLTTLSQIQGSTIAAPGDDRVYVAFMDIPTNGDPTQALVMSSADNGETFGAPVRLGAAEFPRYGTVFAEPANPLRAIVAVPDGSVAPQLYAYETTDGGATWLAGVPVAPTRAGAEQHPAGWFASDGRAVIGYYDAGAPGGERFVATVLDDGAVADEAFASTLVSPGANRREYLGFAGGSDVGFAAWVGGDAASRTWIEVARFDA